MSGDRRVGKKVNEKELLHVIPHSDNIMCKYHTVHETAKYTIDDRRTVDEMKIQKGQAEVIKF